MTKGLHFLYNKTKDFSLSQAFAWSLPRCIMENNSLENYLKMFWKMFIFKFVVI